MISPDFNGNFKDHTQCMYVAEDQIYRWPSVKGVAAITLSSSEEQPTLQPTLCLIVSTFSWWSNSFELELQVLCLY